MLGRCGRCLKAPLSIWGRQQDRQICLCYVPADGTDVCLCDVHPCTSYVAAEREDDLKIMRYSKER